MWDMIGFFNTRGCVSIVKFRYVWKWGIPWYTLYGNFRCEIIVHQWEWGTLVWDKPKQCNAHQNEDHAWTPMHLAISSIFKLSLSIHFFSSLFFHLDFYLDCLKSPTDRFELQFGFFNDFNFFLHFSVDFRWSPTFESTEIQSQVGGRPMPTTSTCPKRGEPR